MVVVAKEVVILAACFAAAVLISIVVCCSIVFHIIKGRAFKYIKTGSDPGLQLYPRPSITWKFGHRPPKKKIVTKSSRKKKARPPEEKKTWGPRKNFVVGCSGAPFIF